MRAICSTILCGVSLVASALAGRVAAAMQEPATPRTVKISRYNSESAYAKFELSTTAFGALTSPLVFEVQADPVPTFTYTNLTLNNQALPVDWNWARNRSDTWPRSLRAVADRTSILLSVNDTNGHEHALNISFAGQVIVPEKLTSVRENVTQDFEFRIESVDDIRPTGLTGFAINLKPTADRRLHRLISLREPEAVNFDHYESFEEDQKMDAAFSVDPAVDEDADDFDIDAEIESLLHLEGKAGDLQAQIAAKKQRIASCLKTHREQVSLRHLLEQCDGIVCAAKVIAQRICDKIGVATEPSFSYSQMRGPHSQHLISFQDKDDRPQQTSRNSTKSNFAWKTPESSEKNITSHQPTLLSFSATKDLDWSNPPSALIRVLGIIASALGLTALIAFIRRKCMSPRSRVERAADREERRNARAYRRAARRAYMRGRWDALVAAVSCFKQQKAPEPPRIEDYEEKRALILQDAFLEQELDQAEKGEVMEAEIRELRHAHDIVSSLVRAGEHRYDLITPFHDPPPPLVPLPYDPTSRSRASSGTLPSYTSESLPGYTSRLATEIGSSNNSILSRVSTRSPVSASSSDDGLFSGSTPLHSAADGEYRHPHSTPSSSVIDHSRPSEDTLRTMRSHHL